MSDTNNTTTVIERQNYFEPLLQPFANPIGIGYLATIVLLLILKLGIKRESVLAKARFANSREIREGTKRGLRQIARGIPKEAALKLENIVLSDIQPGIAIVGKSGCGKTRSVIDPAIKNAIDQEWTNLVFDVKGELIRKHAAYALSKGYQMYVYAPGYEYSDGLNFLKFMKDKNDAKTAQEIAKVIDANFGEPGERKDGFFSSQGAAALKLAFMMAKASPFSDLIAAWKFLSLPNLAKRLSAAYKYGGFDEKSGFSIWIKEAATAMRSMAEANETVDGIVGTAMTHFQNMVDPSIVPCLLNHTIPLDLTGKQIVFFQLDENAKSATAPLVAAAIHMLVTRNLNASVKRKNTLGLFLDEFDSLSLPDIKDYITKMREYGLAAFLSYQSEAQVNFRYTRPYAESILSSCGIKIYFNTGHPETAEKLSRSLGKKEVKYTTTSRTYGGRNASRNLNEHIQQIPLITGNEINEQVAGKAVIAYSPGFDHKPYQIKFKKHKKNDILWKKSHKLWFRDIKPYREERIVAMTGDVDTALIDREIIAEAMLPSAEEFKILSTIAG
ncbi:type IV secretory system conjugative DNA transfer family protein [Myxosarcina sp. GI1]|uniref:type IV secretory system conjugative DNA transfer family protein n=1 Tax=Myxosarcina sp. GI1 TaxID=1541065 RepID=UPI00068B5A9C|nr:type IV secretory system conjugative DNA transfer family protein [Myxosarcina sp. GI1]